MINSIGQINVCTDFEINRFGIDEVRKYAKIVCFIWRHVTQKRYVVRHGDHDTSDRYFYKEQPEVSMAQIVVFEFSVKSLRLPVQKLWLK